LLATDKPVLIAPAMNTMMWTHGATQANVATLNARGIRQIGPEAGDLACGEVGSGRMAEPMEILAAIESYFGAAAPLSGRRAIVTSGPTFEAIDPVRFIGNRSSGKQGHAIAAALARRGAATLLVSGPTSEPDPAGVEVKRIESAEQMLAACRSALPADIAVCAAAVADWRPAKTADQKIKKAASDPAPITLLRNPDILATLAAAGNERPRLVVGFAAETENLIANARKKLAAKGCDLIVANDVSADSGTFGGSENTVHLVAQDGVESWPRLSKQDVAERLVDTIVRRLATAT
jgi:phosphopantothenoylcysteine decarboxylase / phosphopantothenate---cysteine ligase